MAKITKTTAIKEVVVKEEVTTYHLELSQKQMDYLYTVLYNVTPVDSQYIDAENSLWLALCSLPNGGDTLRLSKISFEDGKMRVRDAR